MGTMMMKLKPSEYRLAFHDGGVLLLDLWERLEATDGHPAKLIWVVRGIHGSKAPAGLASGLVPCSFADDPYDVVGLRGGSPRDGFEVVVEGDVSPREVIVKAPDGLLEPATILTTKRLELR